MLWGQLQTALWLLAVHSALCPQGEGWHEWTHWPTLHCWSWAQSWALLAKVPKFKFKYKFMKCNVVCSTRHEQQLKWLRLNKIVTYLTHWAPHPTMVLGLGKKPARQRQTAAPLPPTEHEVLGPQGVGWQGSPWGRARAHPTSKLTASSLICNLMNAFFYEQLKLILNWMAISFKLEAWSFRNGLLYFCDKINFCQGILWFILQSYLWYLNSKTNENNL